MKEHIVTDRAEYYATVDGGDIKSTGQLTPGLHIVSPDTTTVIIDTDENEFLSQVNAVGVAPNPLPAIGEHVKAGAIYAWNGQNVIARQDHSRTEHDPDTVPALFSVWRETYDGIEWVANEPVLVGNQRKHNSVMYEVIQSHTTEFSPDLTPGLWKVATIGEWPDWVQPLGAQDAYSIDAQVTHNGSQWISQYADNVWEPGVFGWVQA